MSFTTIPQNLNRGISNARDYVDDQANVLFPPNTAQGISGFVFDIVREDQLELSSDITDHFTEDNSFIQDHIVRRPRVFTMSGFQGELVFESPRGIAGASQLLQNRLETVEAYLGDRTPGQIQQAQEIVGQAQTAISTINQTLDRVQNVVGSLESAFGPEITRQQRAYAQLSTLWRMNATVTLRTPWVYFESMLITNITFVQGEASQDISEISVSLKEFRTAETRTTGFDESIFENRETIQSAETEDQGFVRGVDESIQPTIARRLNQAAGGQ